MSENIAALHAGYKSIVDMHIGTAYRGKRHAHDDVAWIDDVGVRNILHAHISTSIPAERLHRSSPCQILRSEDLTRGSRDGRPRFGVRDRTGLLGFFFRPESTLFD